MLGTPQRHATGSNQRDGAELHEMPLEFQAKQGALGVCASHVAEELEDQLHAAAGTGVRRRAAASGPHSTGAMNAQRQRPAQ